MVNSPRRFLKRRTRTQDGKTHTCYSVGESLRVSRDRVGQRQGLQLGERTPQLDAWQHSIDVLHEAGRRRFTDREPAAPDDPDGVAVQLSSFAVRSPRRLGDCWTAIQLWAALGLHTCWRDALAADAGDVPGDKVLELLVVNRLLAPRSELFVPEKWFPQSAMDVLLDTGARVADKDRRDRCRGRLLVHQPALEQHLAQKWQDLFGATFDRLLDDRTSTCFEGAAAAAPQARRGCSRDHRPDCQQLVLALVVTPEGFPLTCEVFPGHRLDRATLAHILDTIEAKFGKARRLWVFDRGIVSDDNLELRRQRGAHYLVGTPPSQLKACGQKLLDGDWQKVSDQVQVQLLPEADEVHVLWRSTGGCGRNGPRAAAGCAD